MFMLEMSTRRRDHGKPVIPSKTQATDKRAQAAFREAQKR